jgi:SAM-dependent methyltransferase
VNQTAHSFDHIDGYVADSAYPSKFHQSFQPPWIDAALAVKGIVPPRDGQNKFTLVDLGCGDGIGLILTAASHPQGKFFGVDAIGEHVMHGRHVIAALGLDNITLIHGTFADVMDHADGAADYVVAQGVLAWVSPTNRMILMDLAARWLRPGGVLAMGYNTYPGWGRIAAFQALVRATAREKDGNSTERFVAAVDQLRTSGAIEEAVWEWLDELRADLPLNYFAHEYLNEHWRPCWSGDVVSQLAERGLAYTGQAGSNRLRDDLCLTGPWRKALTEFSTVPAREIAIDLFTDSWFRRDLYIKLPAYAFDKEEVIASRMASWWIEASGVERDLAMTSETPAGEISFDNEAARVILATLARGPCSLSAIAANVTLSAADLLNSIDALWIAGRVFPIDPPDKTPLAEPTNDWLTKAGIAINGIASPFGALLK